MNEINKQNMNEFVVSGVFDIVGKTSLDEDMKKQGNGKTCTFRFSLVKVPFAELLGAALTPKKITKQNHIRSNWDLYKEGQVIEFNWAGGRVPVDPEAAYYAKLEAMPKEKQQQEIEAQIAKLRAMQSK